MPLMYVIFSCHSDEPGVVLTRHVRPVLCLFTWHQSHKSIIFWHQRICSHNFQKIELFWTLNIWTFFFFFFNICYTVLVLDQYSPTVWFYQDRSQVLLSIPTVLALLSGQEVAVWQLLCVTRLLSPCSPLPWRECWGKRKKRKQEKQVCMCRESAICVGGPGPFIAVTAAANNNHSRHLP